MDYIDFITSEGRLEVPSVSVQTQEDVNAIINGSEDTEVIAIKLAHAMSIRANIKNNPPQGNDYLIAETIRVKVMDAIWVYSLVLIKKVLGDEFFESFIQRGDDEDLIVFCVNQLDDYLEDAYRNNISHGLNMENMSFALMKIIKETADINKA